MLFELVRLTSIAYTKARCFVGFPYNIVEVNSANWLILPCFCLRKKEEPLNLISLRFLP
ncbi:hypothetical protein H1P_1850007 [Hyella patelloides LEGE 07179]|uniref:Uncharacterized protein n=1 Tax=Hyella patelloides LEGE 07179 TaxID=945734 RepID=A0A563VP01_9CYAN|nr:hypothetical protein H1P_1850007 [Hyella patelloides LEGE 07179]